MKITHRYPWDARKLVYLRTNLPNKNQLNVGKYASLMEPIWLVMTLPNQNSTSTGCAIPKAHESSSKPGISGCYVSFREGIKT